MEPHRHDAETGEVILAVVDEPSPEEVAARAAEHAAEATAEAQVEIARIESDTAVQLAKIERAELSDEERIELEALRMEVATLREIAAPPEPEPVVVEAPEPEPVDEMPADAPPEVEGSPEPGEHKRKVGLGMW